MFKHILVPVDGSDLSEKTIEISVSLARQLGASVTAFVAEPLPPLAAGPQAPLPPLDGAVEQLACSAAQAESLLQHFEACAQAAGVPFDGYIDPVPRVPKAVIAAAEARGCDLLVMAAHGRGAFGEFLFGSESKAVLADCKLPLLVLR
jgi:nucleotide-binding universal stress UspA family protein